MKTPEETLIETARIIAAGVNAAAKITLAIGPPPPDGPDAGIEAVGVTVALMMLSSGMLNGMSPSQIDNLAKLAMTLARVVEEEIGPEQFMEEARKAMRAEVVRVPHSAPSGLPN